MKNIQRMKVERNHAYLLFFISVFHLLSFNVYALSPSLYISCDSTGEMTDLSGLNHELNTHDTLAPDNLVPGVVKNAWLLNSKSTSLDVQLKQIAFQPENTLSFWFNANNTDDTTLVSNSDHAASIVLKDSRLVLRENSKEHSSLGTTLPAMSDTWTHLFLISHQDNAISLYLNGELILNEKLASPFFKGTELHFGSHINSEVTIPNVLAIDEIVMWPFQLSKPQLDSFLHIYNSNPDQDFNSFSRKHILTQFFDPSKSNGKQLINRMRPDQVIELNSSISLVSSGKNTALSCSENKYAIPVPFSYNSDDFSFEFSFQAQHEKGSLALLTLPLEGSSYLAINSKNNVLEGVYYIGRKEKTITFINEPNILPNEWHQFRLVYSAKDSIYFAFLNNRLVGEIPSVGKPNPVEPAYFGFHPRTEHKALPIHLGQIAIFQSARHLDASEFPEMHPYTATVHPVIHQGFEPLSKMYAFDHNLFGVSLPSLGKYTDPTSTEYKTSPVGFALDVSNTKNALIIPSIEQFDTISELTFCVWLNPSTFGNKRKIFSKRDLTNSKRFLILSEDQGYLLFGAGDGREFSIAKTTRAIPQNEWTHIAGVFSSSTKSLTVYINGVQDVTIPTRIETLNLANFPITLGADFEGNSDHFDGSMDEFLLFNVSLSPEQISPFFLKKHTEFKKLKISDTALKNYQASLVQAKKEPSTVDTHTASHVAVSKNPQDTSEHRQGLNAFRTFDKSLTLSQHIQLGETLLALRNQHPEMPTFLYTKLNYFKELKIFSQISFENKNLKFFDLVNPAVSINLESQAEKKPILGVSGLGCHIDEKSFIQISNLKIHPYFFSISLWVKPLESPHMKSFLSIRNGDGASIALHVMKNFVTLSSTSDMKENLNVYLTPHVWQQLAFSFDLQNNTLKAYKNGILLSTTAIESKTPFKNPEIVIGRDHNQYSFPMIIDEIMGFQEVFGESVEIPLPPLTPYVSIREKNAIRSDQIKITLFAQNATEYIVSDSPDFVGGKWKPYTPIDTNSAIQVTGPHKIYVKFKNEHGVESDTVSDTYHFIGSSKGIIYTNPIPGKIIPGKR